MWKIGTLVVVIVAFGIFLTLVAQVIYIRISMNYYEDSQKQLSITLANSVNDAIDELKRKNNLKLYSLLVNIKEMKTLQTCAKGQMQTLLENIVTKRKDIVLQCGDGIRTATVTFRNVEFLIMKTSLGASKLLLRDVHEGKVLYLLFEGRPYVILDWNTNYNVYLSSIIKNSENTEMTSWYANVGDCILLPITSYHLSNTDIEGSKKECNMAYVRFTSEKLVHTQSVIHIIGIKGSPTQVACYALGYMVNH